MYQIENTLYQSCLDDGYTRQAVFYAGWISEKEFKKYPGIVLGTFGATSLTRKLKFKDVERFPVSRSEIAIEYLKHIYKLQETKRKMIPYNNRTKKLIKDAQAPRYYQGGYIGGFYAHSDIRAAHFSLYSPLSLDVRFDAYKNPMHLGLGKVDFLYQDWLQTRKFERNLISGALIRKTEIIKWNPKKDIYREQFFNKFLAPELHGYIQLTLQAIAYDAITKFGCVRWFVDGGIFPGDKVDAWNEYVAEEWGLLAETDTIATNSQLWNINTYRIGSRLRGKYTETPGGRVNSIKVTKDQVDRLRFFRQKVLKYRV